MKYEEFIEEVQKRGSFPSRSDAARATQATLETLAEWISPKERIDTASQLPHGLALYLKQPYLGEGPQPSPTSRSSSSLEEFFQRMGIREDVPAEVARTHAHVVMSVLIEAVSQGELEDIRAQLPVEFHYEFFQE